MERWGRRKDAGFTVIELMVVLGLLSVLLTMGFLQWRDYTELQRVRYGTTQLATDVREALERAKSERVQYVVNLTAASSTYTIVRTGGGFSETTELPTGVTPTGSWVVYLSAFGKPTNALGTPTTYTLAVSNPKGTGTVTVTTAGGVTYQDPD